MISLVAHAANASLLVRFSSNSDPVAGERGAAEQSFGAPLDHHRLRPVTGEVVRVVRSITFGEIEENQMNALNGARSHITDGDRTGATSPRSDGVTLNARRCGCSRKGGRGRSLLVGYQ